MKTLKCRDVGFDCNGVIQGRDEQEVLTQATQHAKQVHHVDVTPQMAEQIKTKIKEDNSDQ